MYIDFVKNKFTKLIYILMNIKPVMRKIKIEDKKLQVTDDIEFLYEKVINKYGTGAKIDAPKEFLGRKVYVPIRKV